MTSYREMAVRSFGWLAAFQVASAAISQVAMIVLATILAPTDFGLFGLAMIVIVVVSIPGDLGLTVELVRRPDFETLLPTALRIRWLVAVGLTAAALAAALLTAIVFPNSSLAGLIAILAGIFPAAALGFGPRVTLTKTLGFKVIAAVDTVGRISGPTVSICFALLGAGYWSLAFGMLFSSWVTPVLLTVLRPVSYAGEFRGETAASLILLGKFVSISTLFGFLVSTGDNIATVAIFGLFALGLYTFAFSLTVTVPRNIAGMIETVVFPIFSRIVGDLERLKAGYLITLRCVSYVAFPVAFGFLVFSDGFVDVILGPKWEAMVAVMQILAFAGLFYSLSVPASSALLALGLVKHVTRALALALLILGIGLAVAMALQVFKIVAVAAVAAAFTYLASLQTTLSRRLAVRYHELLARVVHPAIAAGLVSWISLAILTVLRTDLMSLTISGITGLIAYFGAVELV